MKETQSIEVLSNRMHIRVPVQNILWMDTRQNAILIHTDAGIIKTYMTYTRMRTFLDTCTDCFLTCYTGCMVNMNRIARVDGMDFLLDNGERVQIRKRDGARIRQFWLHYRCGRTRTG